MTQDRKRLCFMSIAEAAKLLERREISPVDLTRSVLNRIDETEERVHAYVTIMQDEAIQGARKAESDIMNGEYRGSLHGIPIALKDIYFTAGTLTQAGSSVLQGFVPSYDSTVTQRLKQAGAIIVGKTVTAEFAYLDNPLPTRNPWDLERTPGGSSAGSAVAVAAHSCLASMGTDTGGSIQMPASVNGVVGFKPTYGRVSKYGVIPLSWSLDHCGPMTKTVEDAALIMNVVAGYDSHDAASKDVPVPDYTQALRKGIHGLRLGVPSNYFFRGIHLAVRDAVEQALGVFEDLGATLVEVTIPHVELSMPIGLGIIMSEASSSHQTWLRGLPASYDDITRTMLEAGEMLFATDYLRALRARTVIKNSFKQVFLENRLDGLITPTQPTTAAKIGQTTVVFEDTGEEPYLAASTRETISFNLAGLPAVSLPCGFSRDLGDEGIGLELPIGMHIAGRPFDESTVLRIGFAYQGATDWHQRWPLL